MAPSDDQLQTLASDLADRLRDQLRRELDGLVADARSLAAREREDASRQTRVDAEAAAASLVSSAIAAERASADERLATASAEALAHERQASLTDAERLVGAVRALDRAASLSEALDVLAATAGAEAGRAAVLVVRGALLRGWAHSGFALGASDIRSIELPVAEAGLLTDAVEAAERRSTSDPDGRAAAPVPQPFTPTSLDGIGLAVPITVDGHIVAVLYADDGDHQAREVPSAWPAHVELLARHASRCLEALTARETSRAGRPTAGATLVELPRPDAEGAQRFARLLISEIKLYHEAQVDEGRRARDLRQRLRAHIERARQLYEERVPPAVRSRGDYFEQELVRTLADGDPILLGQAS
jgi:hypothetical protein